MTSPAQTPPESPSPSAGPYPRKESIPKTLSIQALGLAAGLIALLVAFPKRTFQILGILWLFIAFFWFYFYRHFYLYYWTGSAPVTLFAWPWYTRPAWMDYFNMGWNGMPWEVPAQAALLLWIAFIVAVLGWKLMRAFQRESDPVYAITWGGGLVLGILAMLVFAIGIAGGLTHSRYVFGGILAVSSAIALELFWRERPRGMVARFALTPLEGSLLWGLAALQFLTLLYALTPEVQSDALRYHLAAPQEWLKAGRLIYLPYNAFSNFPSNIEMLFLFGMGLSGDLLARGFHFLFLPLSTGAVALIAREIGGETSGSAAARRWWEVRPAMMAAAAWGTLPIATLLAGWGFVDLGLTFYVLALVFFLLRWTKTRHTRDWLLAALFGGLLCGSKYTGVVMVFWSGLLLGLFGLLQPLHPDSEDSPGERFGRRALRSLLRAAMFGAVAAAIASPWWIKNYAYTGNPVYPMAYSVFGGGEWNDDLVRLYHEKTQEKGIRAISRGPFELLKNTLLLPWLTLTDSRLFESFETGPLFWVFFPWILVWCLSTFSPRALGASHAPPMLALWMLCFCVFWFFSYQSNRFFLPGWALASAMIAASLARVGQWSSLIRALCLMGLLLPTAYGGVDSAKWLLFDAGNLSVVQRGGRAVAASGVDWPAYTLGYLTRQDYLALHLNYARSAEYCSARLKSTDKVLLVGEHRKMHWLCAVEGNDWYDQPRILPFLNQAKNAEQLLEILLAQGFTHIFFNLDEWGWPRTAGNASPGELPAAPRGSAWDYNGRHFSRANISLLQDLLKSNRLKVMQTSIPGRAYVAKILPGSV